jgi:hypothetical protein
MSSNITKNKIRKLTEESVGLPLCSTVKQLEKQIIKAAKEGSYNCFISTPVQKLGELEIFLSKGKFGFTSENLLHSDYNAYKNVHKKHPKLTGIQIIEVHW